MKISFQLHGVLTKLAGCEAVSVDCARPVSVDCALDMLVSEYPALEPELRRTACAIGESLVTRDTLLKSETEVALIPPVSGG